MEPNSLQNTQNKEIFLNNINSQFQESQEIPSFERPFEEVEDGYVDDRGFYTTPNGSFWDNTGNYFNRFGFDVHGGTYDKYGIYQPGKDYDEKSGYYNNDYEKNLIKLNEEKAMKNIESCISKLRDQEKKDEKIIKKYSKLEEESEDEEDEDDKSNVTYDENDMKEAFEYVMESENHNDNIMKKKGNNIDLDMNEM